MLFPAVVRPRSCLSCALLSGTRCCPVQVPCANNTLRQCTRPGYRVCGLDCPAPLWARLKDLAHFARVNYSCPAPVPTRNTRRRLPAPSGPGGTYRVPAGQFGLPPHVYLAIVPQPARPFTGARIIASGDYAI